MEPREDSAIVELLATRVRPRTFWVELTSRCNARCVYCGVSQPWYAGRDLELSDDALLELVARQHPLEVRLSGNGETTMLPHWSRTARRLLERGFELTLNTNLTKPLSDDELDVLSRFRSLEISCDSADAELLAKLRRGVRLERIEENLARLHETCRRARREPPYLNIGCTLTDLTLPGLPELVRWVKRHGAHALGVVNMERYPEPAGAVRFRHPAEGDPRRALETLAETRALAAELGLAFFVQPGLVDALEDALR
ncbi:MAG: radical SAM protein [Planctomycetes bacterium]|nr:radical SAM protein [Planctomycetota bacterium]